MLMKLLPALVIIVTSINKKTKCKERIKAEEKKRMKCIKKEVLILAILPFPVLELKISLSKNN